MSEAMTKEWIKSVRDTADAARRLGVWSGNHPNEVMILCDAAMTALNAKETAALLSSQQATIDMHRKAREDAEATAEQKWIEAGLVKLREERDEARATIERQARELAEARAENADLVKQCKGLIARVDDLEKALGIQRHAYRPVREG